jgi:hypothetical protein
MNTRLGKSFGLAFVVAVGILALMFALGTFNSQQVGADVDDTANATKSVTTNPDAPGPGAGIGMTLMFQLDSLAVVFDEITISLEDFGVPATIAERSISVRVGDSAGAAAAVDVSGDNIVVELPDLNDDIAGLGIDVGAVISIIIRKNAGITVPSTAGDYPVTVAYNDDDAVELGKVEIDATLSVDPEEGGSGTEVTVSGKAFADGTGTLSTYAYEADGPGSVLKDVTVVNGAFSTTVDADDLDKAAANGMSVIMIVDADGTTATETFTVTGTTTLGADSVGKGELLEISIADWIGALPNDVKIGGISLTIVDEDGNDYDGSGYTVALIDGADTFYVKIGGEIGLGTKTVVLLNGNDRLDTASVEITSLDLSVSPSSAVPGQEITVEGTGFTSGLKLATLTVGGVAQTTLSNRNSVSGYDVLSGGRIVITFAVPAEVTEGSNTIRITDDEGRVGEVALTVPEPMITLDPTTSRRATTVTVTGTGFPAGENISVNYGEEDDGIASGRTDNTGNFTASFGVPSDAAIGGEIDVTASIMVDGPDADEETTTYSAEATHSVPDKEITVTPDVVRSGETVQIVGTGFPRYSDVEVKVGEGEFRTTDARTDEIGDFTTSAIIPGIDPGTHVIQVRAGNEIATWVITVPVGPAPMVSADPADVFADLIEAGTLVEVLQLVRTSDTDITWLFYKPGEMFEDFNTYSESESGDILFVNVSSQTTFQGKTLYTGWNQHVLD